MTAAGPISHAISGEKWGEKWRGRPFPVRIGSTLAWLEFGSWILVPMNRAGWAPEASFWPEVGSRAMQRIIVESPGTSMWIEAQRGRYRYIASVADVGTVDRFVLSEYLACEVVWGLWRTWLLWIL